MAQEVHEAGDHTVSVDEMTGIQALERKYSHARKNRVYGI